MGPMDTFESDLLHDIVGNDHSKLYVTSQGLSFLHVLGAALREFTKENNLVFVLSASAGEEEFLSLYLQGKKHKKLSHNVILKKRQKAYEEGGIIFISTRILLMDMMKGAVPVANIHGITLLHAHLVDENTQEAFVLRVFRADNKTGFIKAFTHNAAAFTFGMQKVHRVMASTYTLMLSVWKWLMPLDVWEENHLIMLDDMHIIHNNLLKLVQLLIDELRYIEPCLNDIDWREGLFPGFEKRIYPYLQKNWSDMSEKFLNSLYMLRVIRHLTQTLLRCDCVDFYSTLKVYTGRTAPVWSSWVLLRNCENIVNAAMRRVSKMKREIPGKWRKTKCIILQKASQWNQQNQPMNVVILTDDMASSYGLRHYLLNGVIGFTDKLIKSPRRAVRCMEQPPVNILEIAETEKQCESKYLQMNIELDSSEDESRQNVRRKSDNNGTISVHLKNHSTIVHLIPVKGYADHNMRLIMDLRRIKPDIIILLSPSLTAYRNATFYKITMSASKNVEMHKLCYDRSSDILMFEYSKHMERIGFTYLDQEKERLNEKWDLESIYFARATQAIASLEGPDKQVVLIDIREFSSDLPNLLHQKGVTIEPVMLEVGDYILTNEIVVERKSAFDLISSLKNGRLHLQAISMIRYYPNPILLIEMQTGSAEQQERFSRGMEKIRFSFHQFRAQFPQIKIIWSPNSTASAKIFLNLKRGKSQPSKDTALAKKR